MLMTACNLLCLDGMSRARFSSMALQATLQFYDQINVRQKSRGFPNVRHYDNVLFS